MHAQTQATSLVDASGWHKTSARPLTRSDIGHLIIARDCCGHWFTGTVAANGGDLVLRPSQYLRPDYPVTLLDEYKFAHATELYI
jgi:hypothetical protein